ncbi:restriction endonuclease subunit S [Bifidobacterium parmae]|uniref:Type I restriction-modification system specificity determinant n=1 Tax=Bifidobacterium parmae TaxID=361854 RepID=A0A2N5IYX9_9BIFI|nr:restriction endonuclease subunit S [Bifidobacterium parmae]PLS27165.1 type I restriction-modification system specificity determinant [Bifidobacterium parmae]
MERYSAYKDSGVDWIGEIPEGWKTIKNKHLAYIRARLGWKGLKAEEYVDDGYPMYSAFNCVEGNLCPTPVNYISRERYDESPEIMLSDGDILLVKDGAGIGKYAVIRKVEKPATVNGSLAVISPTPNMESRYLGYFYASMQFQDYIHLLMDGMGVPHLFQRDLKQVPVIVPPKAEQQSIADYLDEKTGVIDAAVKDIERSIELLNEYRQSVISEAVTKGLDPTVPMKDSGIDWIGQIPEHWSVLYPKKLFALRKERAHADDQQLTASQKYGVISQKRFMALENQRVMAVLTGNDILKHVEAGDFVISMRSFQGGLEYSYESGKISSAYVMVHPFTEQTYSEYYKYLFKTWAYIQALQSTSNLVRDGQALRYANFAQVYLPVPSIEEQQMIAHYLDDATENINSLIQQKQSLVVRLKEYRASLISECVTGKVKVPGVEE